MSKRKYFGTDGIRGRVGSSLINPEFVLKLGWAVGRVLADDHRKQVIIGKDTRVSGYMLESALESGLAAAGIDVRLLGPMPTPGIAYLTQTLRASAGIVISASHNPFEDNGIKFFAADGGKLPDPIELAIEEEMHKPLHVVPSALLGKASRVTDAQGRYIEFCKSTFPGLTKLEGLKIVIDCANGATYHIAPNVFSELGAEVIAIGNKPDGFNINQNLGSTAPETLQQHVLLHQADIGIALDGDGDRVILVDHTGKIVDGDQIIYLIAKDRLQSGILHGGVVGTQMSNLGLEMALNTLDVPFIRTKVGDRYVLEALKKNRWRIGGEPSGHVVCLDKTTTGDGIVAALQVLAIMLKHDKKLRELTAAVTIFPQKLLNIKTQQAERLLQTDAVQLIAASANDHLKGQGRVLLRASGTEPLLRVMVEGRDKVDVEQHAQELVAKIKAVEYALESSAAERG